MAYSDFYSPARVLNRETSFTHRLLSGLGNAFYRVFMFMSETSVASQRVEQARVLQSLSDEQLAKKGIRREDIVRIVFADMITV